MRAKVLREKIEEAKQEVEAEMAELRAKLTILQQEREELGDMLGEGEDGG